MRFRVVTGNTARNPVARAIARARVHDRLMAAKLRIYTLDEGQDDSDYLSHIQRTMIVVGTAIEAQYHGATMPIEVSRDERVLRGGLSALQQCASRWDPAQAVAVEQAIDATERLNKVAQTAHLYDAALKYGLV
jgi:hypothetical protein